MKKIKKISLILTTTIALLSIVSCSNYVDQTSSSDNNELISNESKTSQTNQIDEENPQSRYGYGGSYTSSTGGSSSYSSGGGH